MPNREDVIKDWSPGVLSQIQINQLIENGILKGIPADSQGIGLSSFDLHITDEAYRLLRGCIRPSGGGFLKNVLQNPDLAERHEHDDDGEYLLKRQNTYVFRLKESFKFAETSQPSEKLFGYSTGKSSIGRLDVLVRMIAEGSRLYDWFEGSHPGDLFLEVTPITFHVKVKNGTALSQLRLFCGDPRLTQLSGAEVAYRRMLYNSENNTDYDSLSVDLTPTKLSPSVSAVGLIAKPGEEPLKLWLKEEYSPNNFWCPIEGEQVQGEYRTLLEKDRFYILRSRELISLPSDVAVYCRAMDESLGEMRIHYAGFVHPFFGRNRRDGQSGTPLIFEIRGHNMNILLRDKEKLANLQFYRMSMPSEQPKEGGPGQAYQNQNLKLSKLFKEWE